MTKKGESLTGIVRRKMPIEVTLRTNSILIGKKASGAFNGVVSRKDIQSAVDEAMPTYGRVTSGQCVRFAASIGLPYYESEIRNPASPLARAKPPRVTLKPKSEKAAPAPVDDSAIVLFVMSAAQIAQAIATVADELAKCAGEDAANVLRTNANNLRTAARSIMKQRGEALLF